MEALWLRFTPTQSLKYNIDGEILCVGEITGLPSNYPESTVYGFSFNCRWLDLICSNIVCAEHLKWITFQNSHSFCKVDVLYPDKKPARGIPLSISVKGTTFAGNEVDIGKNTLSQHVNINFEDTTNDQGRATFVIDSPGNMKKMKIKVSADHARQWLMVSI